jgi:tRNA G46 methylase TrmB
LQNRLLKFDFFRKFLKNLESISRCLVKTDLKNLNQRVIQNSLKCKSYKNRGKKENRMVFLKFQSVFMKTAHMYKQKQQAVQTVY